jgi:dsRNA-specific ribonuclease
MEKPLDAFEVKLALKIRELVSDGLVEEDIERLLTAENIRRFKWAVTHRYASADNSEIDELMGDKANGYLLLKWLRKTYPNERRESALSIIVAKFLSKEKLAQYSKELGLRELLIKPPEFKQT